jgi:Ca2+-binding EF-hand superfamily protein
MKARINQIFLCIFIFLVVLLAVSWAQISGDEKLNDAENEEADTINAEQVQEDQEGKVDSWWKERPDLNKDGSIDAEELDAWNSEKEFIDLNRDGQIDDAEKRLAWKCIRSPIKTELEQKFDENNDGWLEPEEARNLLIRRVDFIYQTNGKGAIKTALEELYDTNGDGAIDLEEVKTLKEDLK